MKTITNKINHNKINHSIYGHEAILNNLLHSIDKNQLYPSLLFSGLEGIGKKKVALKIAQSLLCSKGREPCFQCESCKNFLKKSHLDLLWIQPDGEFIKVENLEKIRSFVFLQSFSKKRIIIIEEAHKMNIQTQNGLLKILEQPPSSVYFILICDSIHKLLPTIRSRVQNILFHPLKIEDLEKIFPNEGKESLKLCRGQASRIHQWVEFSSLRSEVFLFWDHLLSRKMMPKSFLSIIRKRSQARLMARFFQELLREILVMIEKRSEENNSNNELKNKNNVMDKNENEKNFYLKQKELQLEFCKQFSKNSSHFIHWLFQKSIDLEQDISMNLDSVLCFENFHHQALYLASKLENKF